MRFIIENIATIVICALLAGIVVSVFYKMHRDRKKGKSACGCGCTNCPSNGMCHNVDK